MKYQTMRCHVCVEMLSAGVGQNKEVPNDKCHVCTEMRSAGVGQNKEVPNDKVLCL